MLARSVSTVEKRSLFLVCKVCWFLLYKFQPRQNFPAFQIFFHFERNSQLFQNLEILGNLKLKQSQLFPAENTRQNLENPKIFGVARSSSCQIPSSNRSWKRLSKFGRAVKFWCGGRSSCQKTPPPAEETKIREKGRIWRKRKKLEEKEIFGRIG